jgi:1-acyl-sn-glycerol-3-phosphate acyltransferase
VIPAAKHRTFNALFAGHARTRIQRTFGRVRVQGLDATARASAEAPLLVVSNHTSWWDPLTILHASEHLLRADGHALMDADNLRRLPFFALVGAFGVDRASPRDGARAIRYAARLLDRPGRLVWVFPQGRERPITERPLGFQGGSAELARIARRAVTIPAALRYEHGEEEKPALYLSFGEPVARDRDVAVTREAQERAVDAELARIEAAVRGDASGFVDVHRAPSGSGDGLATAALAMLTRGAFLRGGLGSK